MSTCLAERAVYVSYVFLGDNEWGNEVMERVANEQLDKHPDLPLHCVHVTEHAGWSLTFARINGRTRIIGTANDMAAESESMRQWREAVATLPYRQLENIRR